MSTVKVRRSGAVIVDDGSPRRRRARTDPKLNAKSKFAIDGIIDPQQKEHGLTLKTATSVVVYYRGGSMTFPWKDVKSVKIKTASDSFEADLSTAGKVRFKVYKEFVKQGLEYFAKDVAAIARISIDLDGNGKFEIDEKQDFEGRVEFFFTV